MMCLIGVLISERTVREKTLISTEPCQENSWSRIFEKETKKDMVYRAICSVLQDVLVELQLKMASLFAVK